MSAEFLTEENSKETDLQVLLRTLSFKGSTTSPPYIRPHRHYVWISDLHGVQKNVYD